MRVRRDLAVAALGVGAAALTAAWTGLRRHRSREGANWFTVTVACPRSTILGAIRPESLADLARRHEVLINVAPAGRGCEIAVRASDSSGRRQLREVKQQLETYEVLRTDGQPEGHRTVFGRAGLELAGALVARSPR